MQLSNSDVAIFLCNSSDRHAKQRGVNCCENRTPSSDSGSASSSCANSGVVDGDLILFSDCANCFLCLIPVAQSR